MKRYSIALVSALLFSAAVFAQDSKPKIAIKTFDNPANFSHSSIGDGLTDILTTELENTGKFTVLERAHVDELMKEMDFGNTEYAKSSSFAQKGNLLGAQYLLTGKVTNFSYVEHAGTRQRTSLFGPNTVQTVYEQQADVRVDFRLIDVASGETVISQAGEGHTVNTSQVSEMETWYRSTTSGSITAELSSSQIGRATTEAVKDIVRKLNALSATVREQGAGAALSASLEKLASSQGQIVADEGGGLWIVGGVGSATGLMKGDHLRVSHENTVKDKTGKVVYHKLAEIGSMEVTDVSEADHAEARFVPGQASAGPGPQVNDLVTVDMSYAPSLRGGTAVGTGAAPPVASSPAGSAGMTTNSQLEQILKRADSYLGDRFWSQALDEYHHAEAVSPADPRVLQGETITQYMMEDFIEGDQSAEQLLRTGGPLTVDFAHYHSMGLCKGQLVVQRGKLTFKSSSADGFEIAPANLEGAEVRRLGKAFMANEKAPDWPVLVIRIRDASGHDKKYEMLPYEFSRQQNLGGKNFASAFPMDDSDLRDVQKLEQSLLTLIQEYVK